MNSGYSFRADARDGSSRRLKVEIKINSPFTRDYLEMKFPRWVPGSYLIREPMQHLSNLKAHIDGTAVKVVRTGVDGIKIAGTSDANEVLVTYDLLAVEMTCRANHLDASHVHIMPPYTWMLPTKGVEESRMELSHEIGLKTPDGWQTATQYPGTEGDWKAHGRDELLDGIMESNSNEMITWEVMGRTQHLKMWDSGGLELPKKAIQRFKKAMTLVIEEHYGLFGLPKWQEYWTIFHFTESGRGGLEHMRSQTSMMPRRCLQEGNEEDWRDLVSLFSHEFLHQWNVKQLRPKNFLDYDLQREVHTNLLWWFEGLTSWLGDIICLRSGVWSEKDWNKDWMRKMKRHHDRNGMLEESLEESSHDAWIHLYRPNSYSRESQISYYLEGEMVIFCLDAELRRRSKGEFGMDDVMVSLFNDHNLDSDNPGISHKDIKKALVNTPGGRRLGNMLDHLVKSKQAPDVDGAFKSLGLELIMEKEQKGAWLGLNMSNSTNQTKVRTHLDGSPCRELIHTGDEILAVNGLRITSCKTLSAAVYDFIDQPVKITLSRQAILKTVEVVPIANPSHPVKVSGKGNKIWRAIKATKRS